MVDVQSVKMHIRNSFPDINFQNFQNIPNISEDFGRFLENFQKSKNANCKKQFLNISKAF